MKGEISILIIAMVSVTSAAHAQPYDLGSPANEVRVGKGWPSANAKLFQTKRTVTFPDDVKKSPGTLLLVPVTTSGEPTTKDGKMIGRAKGTITVPPSYALYLVVNSEGVRNLDCLARLKPNDLYRLRIHDVPIASKSFSYITALTELEDLELGKTDTKDDDLKALAKLKMLQRLKVGEAQVHGPGLASLSSIKTLRELDLSSNRLEGSFVKKLSTWLPKLEKLDLSETKIGDDCMPEVGKLVHLRKLDISDNQITDKAIDSLKNLKALTKLTVENTGMTRKGLRRLQDSLPNCKVELH